MPTPKGATAPSPIAALSLAALLAATGCVGLPTVYADVTEDVSRTLPLVADGELRVENVNGSVEIEAWDRDEVEIQAVKKANGQDALDRIEIVIAHTPQRIDIETELPKGWNTGASVRYEIKVPSTASVDAETVNGAVRVRGAEGPLEVESVNGAVEVAGAAGPVSAKTVNGSLEVAYARTPAGGGHRYKSVNGAIRVRLPDDVSGSFDGDTVNGGIETDFPLRIKKAKYGPKSSMHDVLGAGGPSFEFETVNGSIKILRAGA